MVIVLTPLFRAHSRNGGKVDYKFYNQLEQVLGQEAVSIDEFDERDEEAKQDSGRVLSSISK